MFQLTAFLLPSSLPTRLGLDPRAERAMKIFTKRSHAQRLFPQRNNMEKHKFSSTLSSKYAKVTCFENSKAFQPQVRIKVQLSTKKILNLFSCCSSREKNREKSRNKFTAKFAQWISSLSPTLHFQILQLTRTQKFPISIASQSLPNWTTAKTQHEKAFFMPRRCAAVCECGEVFFSSSMLNAMMTMTMMSAGCVGAQRAWLSQLEWGNKKARVERGRKKRVNTKIAKKMGHVWSAYSNWVTEQHEKWDGSISRSHVVLFGVHSMHFTLSHSTGPKL